MDGDVAMDGMVSERTRAEQGQLVMPFYLICDVSYSMSGDMVALNDGVERLHRAIVTQPAVDDVAQICIMSFSDTAKVVMPLGRMSEQSVPKLKVEGGTVYGAAFRKLAQCLGQDTTDLKQQGFKVYRPCAFFLTDGEPNDRDWHKTFTSTLTYDRQAGSGLKNHPIFVPFGFRAASESVLKQLAYPPERGKWYHAKTNTVEQALAGILDIIMNTVVTAGRTASAGQPTLTQQPPVPGSGIQQGNSEYDPDYV
jgi:uncharacterized protein YegL